MINQTKTSALQYLYQSVKLRWCTERQWLVVEFWLAVASAVIACGPAAASDPGRLPLAGSLPPPLTTYWRRP